MAAEKRSMVGFDLPAASPRTRQQEELAEKQAERLKGIQTIKEASLRRKRQEERRQVGADRALTLHARRQSGAAPADGERVDKVAGAVSWGCLGLAA